MAKSKPAPAPINEDQARFSQLISDANNGTASATPAPPAPPTATVGRMVHYHSKHGDGIVSPAVVLRTRASTNLDVIGRWGDKPDGTASGVARPKDLVAELPDDETVDLLVHGLGGDYREYAVPFAYPTPEVTEPGPGTWSWPPRS